MGFPFIGLVENTPKNRADVRTQWDSQPQTNRLLIGDAESVIDYIQPTAGSYDPFPILQWIDALIARKTQMNKLMLEGEPAGHLSASETAISNWERDIKEQMVFWRAQWQPIWRVLGAAEDCAFNDPSRPAFISLMEGIEKMVTALLPIVEPEDIVKMANMYLEKHGEQFELRARKDDPLMQQQNQPGGNNNDPKPNETG